MARTRNVTVTDQEKHLCELLVKGVKKCEAYREAGFSPASGGSIIKKPHVAEYLELLKTKTKEVETTVLAERAGKKLALSLDMADDRLIELLKARRFTMADRALLRMNGDGENEAPAVPDDAPIEDMALLKAIESNYKRLGGIAGNSTTVNLQNNTQVQVYQSKWKQEPPTIDAPQLPAGDE